MGRKLKVKSDSDRAKEDRSNELKAFKLGAIHTEYPNSYSPEVLEAFENRHSGKDQWVSLICTEFTSLCPKTGQPDFAKIFINYIADEKMVESKSLKLYLFGFRNHGDFHEDCIQIICDDLVRLMRPKYIEVIGEFTPRGGICIFPYSQYAKAGSKNKYKKIAQRRADNFSPGLYSVSLNRIY